MKNAAKGHQIGSLHGAWEGFGGLDSVRVHLALSTGGEVPQWPGANILLAAKRGLLHM